MSRGSGDKAQFVSYGTGRRKLVAWCVPTFGMVSARWVAAHYRLGQPSNVAAVHLYVEGREVGDARNDLIARALAFDDASREVSHVFFLDDDVLPHPEALKKLHADDRDIVSGLYYMKYATPTPLVFHEEGEGVATRWTPGDIVDCAAHGMGLTLIKTAVLRRMRDELDLGVDQHGNPAWFRTLRDQAIVTPEGAKAFVNETEDVYFLKRARSLGYQPCVDTSPQAFGWHWSQEQHRAYPLKQWTEYQTTGRITWPDTAVGAVAWEDVA